MQSSKLRGASAGVGGMVGLVEQLWVQVVQVQYSFLPAHAHGLNPNFLPCFHGHP